MEKKKQQKFLDGFFTHGSATKTGRRRWFHFSLPNTLAMGGFSLEYTFILTAISTYFTYSYTNGTAPFWLYLIVIIANTFALWAPIVYYVICKKPIKIHDGSIGVEWCFGREVDRLGFEVTLGGVEDSAVIAINIPWIIALYITIDLPATFIGRFICSRAKLVNPCKIIYGLDSCFKPIYSGLTTGFYISKAWASFCFMRNEMDSSDKPILSFSKEFDVVDLIKGKADITTSYTMYSYGDETIYGLWCLVPATGNYETSLALLIPVKQTIRTERRTEVTHVTRTNIEVVCLQDYGYLAPIDARIKQALREHLDMFNLDTTVLEQEVTKLYKGAGEILFNNDLKYDCLDVPLEYPAKFADGLTKMQSLSYGKDIGLENITSHVYHELETMRNKV